MVDDSPGMRKREAQRHELTLCRGFQCLPLAFLTCGAKSGEFGNAKNNGIGGEEKSAIAATGCFLNSRHESSQVREHGSFPDHSRYGEKKHGDGPVGRGDLAPPKNEDA